MFAFAYSGKVFKYVGISNNLYYLCPIVASYFLNVATSVVIHEEFKERHFNISLIRTSDATIPTVTLILGSVITLIT